MFLKSAFRNLLTTLVLIAVIERRNRSVLHHALSVQTFVTYCWQNVIESYFDKFCNYCNVKVSHIFHIFQTNKIFWLPCSLKPCLATFCYKLLLDFLLKSVELAISLSIALTQFSYKRLETITILCWAGNCLPSIFVSFYENFETRSAKADGQCRMSSEFRFILICIHGILNFIRYFILLAGMWSCMALSCELV